MQRLNFQNLLRSLECHTQRRSLHSNNFTAITRFQQELIQRQTSFVESINRLLPTDTSRRSCIYERIFVLDHSAKRSLATRLKTCRVQPEVNIRSRIDSRSPCDPCQPICAVDFQLGDSEARICCRWANDERAVVACSICTCNGSVGLNPSQLVELE